MYLKSVGCDMNRSWAVSCFLNVSWTAGWVSTHICGLGRASEQCQGRVGMIDSKMCELYYICVAVSGSTIRGAYLLLVDVTNDHPA